MFATQLKSRLEVESSGNEANPTQVAEVSKADFLEFYDDIERHLDDLKDALKKTRNAKELAQSLKKKGALSTLFGSVSGRNTKDLANMVEDLGASMETTQIILQLIMKVQNTKNQFLKQFHESLVNKISLIQDDTSTLDSNQRQAAVAIVQGLKDQVENQLEQQEMVERHQKKLHALDGFVAHKNSLDTEQDEKIKQLESRAMDIIRTDQEQQRLIEELKARDATKDELDQIQTQRIDSLMVATSEIEMYAQRNRETIETMTLQQDMLIKQVRALDRQLEAYSSFKSKALRQVLPSIAIVVGAVALGLTVV